MAFWPRNWLAKDRLLPATLLATLLAVVFVVVAASSLMSADRSWRQDNGQEAHTTHVVARGETLWGIALAYGSNVDAIAEANNLVDPGRIQVGQVLTIPDSSGASATPDRRAASSYRPLTLPITTPSNRSERDQDSAEPSESLQANVSQYVDMARSNVRTVDGRRAVVPSPIYANGIYARDAFYALFGVEDLDLSDESYRWFEAAQNAESGQITTAVPFDRTDASLQPQDDETTLLFVIWAGILHRSGRPVDRQVVENAWRFIHAHVEEGRYVSPPGPFRYWADCWASDASEVIAYNQGFYALAARFAYEMEVAGVTQQTIDDAVWGYRSIYRPSLGFLPQSAGGAGRALQDVSALLPELLHRYLHGQGMLDDAAILSSVNHRLATASVYLEDDSLIGIKNMATADGSFAAPALFACESMRRPGDYHNGGYWPMYTLAELALAYSIEPQGRYRLAIEQLVERELSDGSPKEYWELSPGREGTLQPGRDDYSWNALLAPVFRWAGLIE